jgi:hypothetical protein
VSDPIKSLRNELVAAAGREAARRRLAATRGPVRSRRLLRRISRPAAIGVLLVVACASGAATAVHFQLFGGAAASGPRGATAAVPASVTLASVRVPDPVSGPPWGIRVIALRRSGVASRAAASSLANRLTCVQIGRVLNGKLRVVGGDRAFGNDGHFDAPSAPSVLCSHALTFIARPRLVLASAFAGAHSCLPPGATTNDGSHHATVCPPTALRLTVFGIASARATAVRLLGLNPTMTEHLTTADRGAFVFVLTATRIKRLQAVHARVTVSYRAVR